MTQVYTDSVLDDPAPAPADFDFARFLSPVRRRWRSVALTGLVALVLGYCGTLLLPAKYTAVGQFLPPQQQQGGAQAALASISAIAGLGGAATGTRNSPEQYIALMQSVTVSDRIIDKFGLQKLWDEKFRVDARKRLAKAVDITTNKKDGLIKIEVTDRDPVRAAAIANRYVDELRTLTNGLAVTEAQQRRVFFERLLEQTRDKLGAAQTALESTGYSQGALNAEPRSAATGYAELRAALTTAEIKLQVLRGSLAEGAPEVARQRETVNALSTQIGRLEAADRSSPRGGDYVGRYREFKYQETLFDLFARQYESARVDESREGALIQVVDPATPPERRSWPKRTVMALLFAVVCMLVVSATLALRGYRALESIG